MFLVVCHNLSTPCNWYNLYGNTGFTFSIPGVVNLSLRFSNISVGCSKTVVGKNLASSVSDWLLSTHILSICFITPESVVQVHLSPPIRRWKKVFFSKPSVKTQTNRVALHHLLHYFDPILSRFVWHIQSEKSIRICLPGSHQRSPGQADHFQNL